MLTDATPKPRCELLERKGSKLVACSKTAEFFVDCEEGQLVVCKRHLGLLKISGTAMVFQPIKSRKG